MKDHWHKVQKLAWMIRRERKILEAKESLIRAFLEKEIGEELMTTSLDDGKNIFD